MDRCKRCKSLDMVWVEFQWWYDWVSMRKCKQCWVRYDRWSGQRIIWEYTQPMFEHWQPMFLLESWAMSRLDELRINSLHKKMKLNRKKPKREDERYFKQYILEIKDNKDE